ncbi:histidine kinase [Natronolimnobius sp. AArcel1]|uniref:MEDS domain-containing protein n=1 Tax=Natronolimnobius sp. AArcel1 TaxID=1679093 RepID=UPI0013EA6352|nr:MEDS domain-containing protein [Natronolimnobius sp. AArcel1]NGM71120.1 histidine kinase [Natronolimnobius sp. AArcel1]
MSQPLHTSKPDVLNLESPLDALQQSPEFNGPIESPDGEFCNDHFALIYESRDEQFAAAVPFIRQGLERGEHCLYVLSETSESAVRDALQADGIDVDAAVDSGALAFATIRETYLENGSFDADEMMAQYAERIEAATAEFEAFRLAAEMDWILEADVSTAECMAYESKVNALFDDKDAIAVCQYNRETFPPEVLCDVIRVHPHLIYDSTVCHNFYYTPPEEFCEGGRSSKYELERMLGTLLDRSKARSALQEREQFLQRQNRITADPDRAFEDKLQALFELGCERFDLEIGAMARVDVERDWLKLEHVSTDEHEHFQTGIELPLSETYCTAATDIQSVGSITSPELDGYDEITAYQEFGIRTYLGTYIDVDGGTDRTFFFLDSNSRTEPFSADERAFLQSMSQWVKYELEQHQRERELERTVDRLETSNERLEQFAYAASHDLQEPLRMISSYLQLIERRADLTAENEEFLEFAVDGADRMREMINGLLTYSRIETRGKPFESVALADVFADACENVQFQLEDSNADLSVDSLPRISGDRSQLRQLFQNLLANAVKYAGEEPPDIEVTAYKDDTEWVISVRDEGIGIAPDEQTQIFEVFDRLHSRAEYDGAGIGLALCERIVERHGGRIWVDSDVGEGSTFSFTLPAATDCTQ